MRVVEQMSINDTAASLGIPVATAKTRLHRANQQLPAWHTSVLWQKCGQCDKSERRAACNRSRVVLPNADLRMRL